MNNQYTLKPCFELNLWHALEEGAKVPQEAIERARWCLFENKHFRVEANDNSDLGRWLIGLGAKGGDTVLLFCRIP